MSKAHHPQFHHNSETYELEVARGNVPNTELFGAFGEITVGGAVSRYIIWPGPTQYHPYTSTAVSGTIQSTSAADAAAGTGIQEVEIHYIDADGYEQKWVTELNGLTPVAIPDTFKFIQCVHADRVGTGLVAAGDISVTSGGVTYSVIKTGASRCTSSVRYVPKGKRLIIREMVAGSNSGTAAASVEVALVATQLGTHIFTDQTNIIYLKHNQVALQDNSEALSSLYIPFDEGALVGMMVTTDKGALVTASWGGWIEDK